jgi:acetone carboxylase gamma subunit
VITRSRIYNSIGSPRGHRLWWVTDGKHRPIRCECGAQFKSRAALVGHQRALKLVTAPDKGSK